MGKIISIINQKGGVGKTTSAVNIAACIGNKNKKVLLIDADPQGNTTSGYGIDKRNIKFSSYDVLVSDITLNEVIIKTKFKNVDLIPSSINLAGAEIELVEKEKRELILKTKLDAFKENYDFIFIDCPPSLGVITINALTSSDSCIIPIQCEYYALEGLSMLVNTINIIKKSLNPKLDIEGVLLTMFDGRLNLTLQVLDEVKDYFKSKVYKTTIPRNVRLSEAPSFGKPIIYYDKGSKGALSYINLADEILNRINKEK